jgi:hypothetical protein
VAARLHGPSADTPRHPTAARPPGRPALTCRRAPVDDADSPPATAITAQSLILYPRSLLQCCPFPFLFDSCMLACCPFLLARDDVLRLHANLRSFYLLLLQAYTILYAWRFQISRSAHTPPAGSRGGTGTVLGTAAPSASRLLMMSASRATDACRGRFFTVPFGTFARPAKFLSR